MLSKEILLKIEWKDMDTVVLTNSKGDTYTSKSEELQDFLHGEPPPPVQSDSGVEEVLWNIIRDDKQRMLLEKSVVLHTHNGIQYYTILERLVYEAMQQYASLKIKELREALEGLFLDQHIIIQFPNKEAQTKYNDAIRLAKSLLSK